MEDTEARMIQDSWSTDDTVLRNDVVFAGNQLSQDSEKYL